MRDVFLKISSAIRVVALGLLGITAVAHAGPFANQIAEFHHTAWTTDPAVGAVFDIQKDQTGFLWLTTSRGILRFDGMRFETLREITQEKIRDNDILSVYASRTGAIWLVTRNAGLKRWQDGRIDEFPDRRCTPTAVGGGFTEDLDGSLWMQSAAGLSHLHGSVCETVGEKRGVPGGMPAAILVDRSGTVWVKTAKGNMLLQRKGKDVFRPWDGPELEASVTGYLHQAPDGSVWLSDSAGLRELTDRDGKISSRAPLKSLGAIAAPLGDFAFAKDGRLWLASHAGLIRVEPFTGGSASTNAFRVFAAKDGLSSNGLWRILADEDGVWVGTNSGLDRLRPTLLHPLPISDPQEHEFAVVAGTGGVWFGNSQTPLTFRSESGEQKSYDVVKSVQTLRRDRAGRIWVASQTAPRLSYVEGGAVHPVAFPDEEVEPVLSMAFDTDNSPWIINRLGTVFRYSHGQWQDQAAFLKKRAGVLGALTADEHGGIWIAFSSKLFHWSAGAYESFSFTDPGSNVSVSTMSARSGHVWLGGRGGLVLFAGGRFRPTTWRNSELPGRISGVVEARDGSVWLNGFSGAAYVPASEVHAFLQNPGHAINGYELNSMDGLPGFSAERIPEPSLSESEDGGTLWFATTKGIASLEVAGSSGFFQRAAPRPVVTALKTDDKPLGVFGAIKVPPLPHRLSISYTALDLGEPERIQFRYQLTGADDAWQDAGRRREVSYDRLSPGRHTFRVQSSMDGEHWEGEQTTLTFTVTPAFYQTWWFGVLLCEVGVGSAYLIFQYRLRREKFRLKALYQERLAERERIARDLHDTLLQGLHGLVLQFQIATDLVPRGDVARPLLEQALLQSDKIILEGRDHVMDLRKDRSSDLERSLGAVGEVWKNSRPTAFRIVADGAIRPLNALVSDEIYLIAREAISNAFRHANAVEILVEISYSSDEFKLVIRDNGRGIDAAILTSGNKPGHWGLQGMRERARKLGADLKIRNHPRGGTEIALRVSASLAYSSPAMTSPLWKIPRHLSAAVRSGRGKYFQNGPGI